MVYPHCCTSKLIHASCYYTVTLCAQFISKLGAAETTDNFMQNDMLFWAWVTKIPWWTAKSNLPGRMKMNLYLENMKLSTACNMDERVNIQQEHSHHPQWLCQPLAALALVCLCTGMPRQLCMVGTALSPLPPCCAGSCAEGLLLLVEPNNTFRIRKLLYCT